MIGNLRCVLPNSLFAQQGLQCRQVCGRAGAGGARPRLCGHQGQAGEPPTFLQDFKPSMAKGLSVSATGPNVDNKFSPGA